MDDPDYDETDFVWAFVLESGMEDSLTREESGRVVLPWAEYHRIGRFLCGEEADAAQSDPNAEPKTAWPQVWEAQPEIVCTVTDAVRDGAQVRLTVQRTCQGMPLRPAQYTLSSITLSEEVPALLGNTFTGGEEFWRLVSSVTYTPEEEPLSLSIGTARCV